MIYFKSTEKGFICHVLEHDLYYGLVIMFWFKMRIPCRGGPVLFIYDMLHVWVGALRHLGWGVGKVRGCRRQYEPGFRSLMHMTWRSSGHPWGEIPLKIWLGGSLRPPLGRNSPKEQTGYGPWVKIPEHLRGRSLIGIGYWSSYWLGLIPKLVCLWPHLWAVVVGTLFPTFWSL